MNERQTGSTTQHVEMREVTLHGHQCLTAPPFQPQKAVLFGPHLKACLIADFWVGSAWGGVTGKMSNEERSRFGEYLFPSPSHQGYLRSAIPLDQTTVPAKGATCTWLSLHVLVTAPSPLLLRSRVGGSPVVTASWVLAVSLPPLPNPPQTHLNMQSISCWDTAVITLSRQGVTRTKVLVFHTFCI